MNFTNRNSSTIWSSTGVEVRCSVIRPCKSSCNKLKVFSQVLVTYQLQWGHHSTATIRRAPWLCSAPPVASIDCWLKHFNGVRHLRRERMCPIGSISTSEDNQTPKRHRTDVSPWIKHRWDNLPRITDKARIKNIFINITVVFRGFLLRFLGGQLYAFNTILGAGSSSDGVKVTNGTWMAKPGKGKSTFFWRGLRTWPPWVIFARPFNYQLKKICIYRVFSEIFFS